MWLVLIDDLCAQDGDVSALLRSLGYCLGSLFDLLRSWGIPTLSSFFSWLCPTPDQAIFQSLTMPQYETRPPAQEIVQHLDFLSFCRQHYENGLFHPLAAPSFGKAWSSREESPCPPGRHTNSSSGHQKGTFSVGALVLLSGPLTGVRWSENHKTPWFHLMQRLPHFARNPGHLIDLGGEWLEVSIFLWRRAETDSGKAFLPWPEEPRDRWFLFLPSLWSLCCPHNSLSKQWSNSYFEQELSSSCR